MRLQIQVNEETGNSNNQDDPLTPLPCFIGEKFIVEQRQRVDFHNITTPQQLLCSNTRLQILNPSKTQTYPHCNLQWLREFLVRYS